MIHAPHRRGRSATSALSVTDRCNLRCSYCMPEKDYVWLPREDMLQFEEIERAGRRRSSTRRRQGAADRRRTAAPPRPSVLVERSPRGRRFATSRSRPTASCWPSTRRRCETAGLHRLTVSLDTLRRDRFMQPGPLRRARSRPRRGIDAAAPHLPRAQDRHRRHPRRQRR